MVRTCHVCKRKAATVYTLLSNMPCEKDAKCDSFLGSVKAVYPCSWGNFRKWPEKIKAVKI
jgi:hypothetical protein